MAKLQVFAETYAGGVPPAGGASDHALEAITAWFGDASRQRRH